MVAVEQFARELHRANADVEKYRQYRQSKQAGEAVRSVAGSGAAPPPAAAAAPAQAAAPPPAAGPPLPDDPAARLAHVLQRQAPEGKAAAAAALGAMLRRAAAEEEALATPPLPAEALSSWGEPTAADLARRGTAVQSCSETDIYLPGHGPAVSATSSAAGAAVRERRPAPEAAQALQAAVREECSAAADASGGRLAVAEVSGGWEGPEGYCLTAVCSALERGDPGRGRGVAARLALAAAPHPPVLPAGRADPGVSVPRGAGEPGGGGGGGGGPRGAAGGGPGAGAAGLRGAGGGCLGAGGARGGRDAGGVAVTGGVRSFRLNRSIV